MKRFLVTIISIQILASLSLASDRMTVVDGYCFLQDQSDHSGSKVVFLADSPSAESDSVYTDQEGFFELGLEEGLYWVSYSHDGFSSYSIPNHVVITSHVTLPDVTLANMVEEVSGDVSGYWGMEHQTYYVIGDVIVPEGDSLFILPGTDVLFLDDTEL